jgi:hypothetical protein
MWDSRNGGLSLLLLSQCFRNGIEKQDHKCKTTGDNEERTLCPRGTGSSIDPEAPQSIGGAWDGRNGPTDFLKERPGNEERFPRKGRNASKPGPAHRHHGWSVVWLGRADLAGAERRSMREWARTKMRAWGERRRYVAKRLTTGRALLGADDIGPEPTAPLFATRIDALNSGARH